MKFDKSALGSSLALSVIHFAVVLVAMKFRPEFLSGGGAGTALDRVQVVLTQPGRALCDALHWAEVTPGFWVLFAATSILWGNVLAFLIRRVFLNPNSSGRQRLAFSMYPVC